VLGQHSESETATGKPWPAIEQEISGRGPDTVRRQYLDALHQLTERNVIAYYSAFLQAPPTPEIQILASSRISTRTASWRRSTGWIATSGWT